MPLYKSHMLLGKRVGLSGVLLLITLVCKAQLTITFPTARLVFQRGNNNQTTLAILGLCPALTDQVEARLTEMNPGQGQPTGWVLLDAAPAQGHFGGRLTVSGGWYRVEVRAWRSGLVTDVAEVKPVGVGEVFVVAGQSNGQGIRNRDAVNPADERVVCSPHFNLNDTIRLPIPFTGAPLSATGTVGPRGQTAWNWGRLGDLLTARLNVPILFYNTAWSGTAVRNWRESITVDSTATSGGDYFRPGMPYGNLKRVVQDYAPLTGLRAVLWHQGESEFYDTDPSASRYAADLQTVIAQCRADAGFALPWVVARASMDNNLYLNYQLTQYAPVINAQNQVIQQVSGVYPGPNTDGIQMPRTDGVHLSGDGLRQVGDAWNGSLTDAFFQNTQPRLPSAITSTDLSLRMYTDQTSPALNTPLRVSLTVDNTGPRTATSVWLRCNLPPALAFIQGAEVTHKRGLILVKLPEVQPSVPRSVTFLVQPTQEGVYQLAAEIVRADQLDVDSQPNTSIGDGQDDLAQVTFRTRGSAGQVYSVPVSVNADPLPAVASNQPAPYPNTADLSLQLVSSRLAVRTGELLSISLIVTNRGGRSSGSVRVGCTLPAALSFLDGAGMTAVSGLVSGTISDLAAGRSATLSFRVTVSTPLGRARLNAEIQSITITDPDSRPGNGYTNGEDDTAQLDLSIHPPTLP